MSTQEDPKSSKPQSGGGLPLWTVLAVLLVLAGLVIGGLAFFTYKVTSREEQLKRELAEAQKKEKELELAQIKAQQDAKLTQARVKQDQLLAAVRTLTNSLGALRDEATTVAASAESLRSGDSGKQVAAHPDLVVLARRLYETEFPAIPAERDVVQRLEAARLVEQQILPNLGTAYEPAAETLMSIQASQKWSEEATVVVRRVRDQLSGLVQQSKAKLSPAGAGAVTLDEAIAALKRNEADAELRQKEAASAAANAEAAKQRVTAEAEAILAKAKLEAERLKQEAEAEAAKRKLESEAALAALELEKTKVKVAVEAKRDEARMVELKKKALDPKVQGIIAPFLGAGYMQAVNMGAEKLPFSLKELQATGALIPTTEGKSKLVHLAAHPLDKERPRWKMNREHFVRNKEQMELVSQAQALLIELGPALVELELWRP